MRYCNGMNEDNRLKRRLQNYKKAPVTLKNALEPAVKVLYSVCKP